MENIDPKLIAIIVLAVIALVEAFIIRKKSKANSIVKVSNKDKKFGANDHYWFISVRCDKKKKELLFTDKQLEDADERATKNSEDIPK